DRDQADLLLRRRRGKRLPGRHHRLEQRQRHGGAHALEDRPAGHVLVRDVHSALLYRALEFDRVAVSAAATSVFRGCGVSAFAIRNAALLTTPRTKADIRLLFFAASRMMARIAGISVYSTRRPRAYVIRFSVKLRRKTSPCFTIAWRSPAGPSILVPS